jgi:translation initiation factor IF-1
MSKTNKNPSTVGTVVEALPNAIFRVQVAEKDEPIMAFLSGKMRLNRIRVLVGDRVELEIDPYGGKSRIIHRMNVKHEG